MTKEIVVALVTAPDTEVAERIVRTLVDEELAACGNIVPGVVSIYRWQGEVQREGEVLIVLKDMWGLGERKAYSVAEWAALSLVRAAIEGSGKKEVQVPQSG